MDTLLLLTIRLDHAVTLGLRHTLDRRRGDRDDRGDVPGWVMVTLMTALLCAALLAIARPALKSMLRDALDKVK